jgi:hypothetical protein
MKVLRKQFAEVELIGFIDLAELTQDYGFPGANGDGSPGTVAPSLDFLAQYFLGVLPSEKESLSTSFQDHEAQLSRDQMEYAARDALLCWDLYHKLESIFRKGTKSDYVRSDFEVGQGAHTPVGYDSPNDRSPICTFDACVKGTKQAGMVSCTVHGCGGATHLSCFKTAAAGNGKRSPVCGACFADDPNPTTVSLPGIVHTGGAHTPLNTLFSSDRAKRANSRSRTNPNSASESDDSDVREAPKPRHGKSQQSGTTKQPRKGGGPGVRTITSLWRSGADPTLPRTTTAVSRGKEASGRGRPRASPAVVMISSDDGSEGDSSSGGDTSQAAARPNKDDSPAEGTGPRARSRSFGGPAEDNKETAGSPHHAPEGGQGGHSRF